MNEDDKPESLGDYLKLSTEDKLRLVTTPGKPKSETPTIAEDLCCEVERLQDELAGTKEALYTEALERDQFKKERDEAVREVERLAEWLGELGHPMQEKTIEVVESTNPSKLADEGK